MTRLLLLHGAGLGSWIWDRVLPHLTVPAEARTLSSTWAPRLPNVGRGFSPPARTGWAGRSHALRFLSRRDGAFR